MGDGEAGSSESSTQEKPAKGVSESSTQEKPATGVSESSTQEKPATGVSESSTHEKPATGVSESSTHENPATGVSESSTQEKPATGVSESSTHENPAKGVSDSSTQEKPATGVSESSTHENPAKDVSDSSTQEKPAKDVSDSSTQEKPATGVSEWAKDLSDADKLEDSYQEIENLWHISQNPLFDIALKEWERKEKELDRRQARRLGESIDLHNQTHNIIGWYAVFQGVVLTAVSQLSAPGTATVTAPLCGKAWFPTVLTLFGTLVTVIGVLRLFKHLHGLEGTIFTEKKARGGAAKRASTLRRKGLTRFSFVEDAKDLDFKTPSFWTLYRFGVIVALLIFTGLFILSYYVILCNTWTVEKWNARGLHR